uniref:Autophagy-related protein 101 n=1 Tax=Strongyloides venezuelensis TaxID=75913 RepID=A0A0K0FJW0_STRVS
MEIPPNHVAALHDLSMQVSTLLKSRSLACDEGTISLVLENVPPKTFTSSCESRVINLISGTINRLLEEESSNTFQGAENEEITLLIDRFESSFKNTTIVAEPSTDMVANWGEQPEFNSSKYQKFTE